MTWMLLLCLIAADPDEGATADGNIDQQVRLFFRGAAIEAEVSVQLGRQAAFAEVLQIDADRDGRLTPEEQAGYFAGLEDTLRRGLELQVDGRATAWRRTEELRLEMPFRKIYRFEAIRGAGTRVEFHNENFAASPGKTSLVVEAAEGLAVLTSADPSTLERDLKCTIRSGKGKVERSSVLDAVPPSLSDGELLVNRGLRVLALVALLGAGTCAWRRRRSAAVLAAAAAGLLGAAMVDRSVPSEAEAAELFHSLHEHSVRAENATVRRVKPLETRIERTLGLWGPEFRVRHRWVTYATASHSGHSHAENREQDGRFRVRWTDGAWRLTVRNSDPVKG